MVRARGISKSYGPVKALVDVDFDVDEGEIVALAGENGSGKSTLARVLAGAVAHGSGAVAVGGQISSLMRPRDALEKGIALVAQEPSVIPEMSIAESVFLAQMGRPLALISRRRLAARAKPHLRAVGVDADPMAPTSSLGPGDRELVEVAKALASEPRLLILDEVTSRLGEEDVERFFTLLRGLSGEGMGIVFITHRLREIVELADRAVVLRDGELVGGLAHEELDEERIASMMVGRELSELFAKRVVDPGEAVLEVRDLVAAGAEEPLSFEVRAGEIVGVAGLVGSGRSELLESIAGVRRSTAGTVLVDGQAVRRGSTRAALESGIALIPEDRHRQGLVLDASMRENVAMGEWHAIGRTHRKRERVAAERAVRKLRISGACEAPVRTLSGGNQQKVVIARGLERSPRVLLLDEPARGIDVGAKHELFELLSTLVQTGAGILLVSSDLLEILGLSDRVLVIHDRRLVAELPRSEATEERVALLSAGGRSLSHAA